MRVASRPRSRLSPPDTRFTSARADTIWSGLAVGPDGRVYWSLADKGHHITTAEGREFHAPNSGGIFRCELDGSRSSAIPWANATPRNSPSTATAISSRWTTTGTTGARWNAPSTSPRDRCTAGGLNWQWLGTQNFTRISGIPAYNPWMEEKLFLPAGKNTAAYLTPTMGISAPDHAGSRAIRAPRCPRISRIRFF